MPSDNDTYKLTEAGQTSETRFGPRPVPPGHHGNADLRMHRHVPSDRQTIYPSPSLTSKIVVWGGIALGVAGATAATVMAARKLGDLMSEDRKKSPPHARSYAPQQQHVAPRFAEMDDDAQEAMRRRVRAQAHADAEDAAHLRAAASRRRRKPKRNLAHELTETASNLSSGLDGVTRSLANAFQGFRSVATQATDIVSEFALAADQLRSVMRGSETSDRHAEHESARADTVEEAKQEERRTHRL